MNVKRITAAVVQPEVAADLESGLERTGELTREAAAAGAELVVFPETWLPGYPAWLDVCRDAGLWDYAPVKAVFARLAENSVCIPGPAADRLAEIARESGVTMVVGVSERVEIGRGQGTLYNTLLTFTQDGRLLNHHRKLIPTYTERMVWGHRRRGGPAGGRYGGGAGRWPGLLGALDAARAPGAARVGREHPRGGLADRARDAPDRQSRHYAFEGPLLCSRRRSADASLRSPA